MTQLSRVLRLSQRPQGVCQAELASSPPDSGSPILRLAARIRDLHEAGHNFETLPDRKHTRVYRWTGVGGSAGGAWAGAGVPPSTPEGLFTPAPAPHWKDAA